VGLWFRRSAHGAVGGGRRERRAKPGDREVFQKGHVVACWGSKGVGTGLAAEGDGGSGCAVPGGGLRMALIARRV